MKRRGDSGAVLLEVLVGLAIFSVGVVTVLGSLRGSIALVDRSENLLRASLVLDEVARRWSRSPDSAQERTGTMEPGGFAWAVEFRSWREGDLLALPLAGGGTDAGGEVAGGNGTSESGGAAGAAPFDLRDEFEILHVTVTWEERGRPHGIETWEIVPLPDALPGEGPSEGVPPEGGPPPEGG